MAWESLRRLCVDAFPSSSSRTYLEDAFEELIDALTEYGIEAEAWINGSFLTMKLDPADIDVVFVIDDKVFDDAEEFALTYMNRRKQRPSDGVLCDAYFTTRFPPWSPRFQEWVDQMQYWQTQFGYDTDGEPKGIALIRVAK